MKEKNIRSGNLKAGYQGRPDSMREEAEKLMKHPGSIPDVIFSSSAADSMPMRKFKTGGSVLAPRRKNERENCKKFAYGGAAKVRHGVATAEGMPIEKKRVSLSKTLGR